MSINSKQLLPLALQTDIWRDFFDCWDVELQLLKDEIDKKKSLLVVDTITDETALIQILKDFGYTPNRILDSSIEFLKKEVKTLLFKVKNKTTYQIYDYFFNIMGVDGKVFNYFFDGMKLVESVDLDKTLTNLSENYTDWTKMFYDVVPILNLNVFLNKQLALDEEDEDFNLDLDKDNIWYLDQQIVVYSTRHLSIDFTPHSLFEKDGEDYLFLKEYSMFFNDIAQYNRKCVEVPHIGLLLSFVMDNTAVYNIVSRGEYTIPDLKVNYATTSATSRYVPSFLLSLDTDDESNPGQLEMDLDKDVTWFLDNESEAPEEVTMFDRFAYICAGIGKKNMIGIEHFTELGDNTKLIGFWDFDNTTINFDYIFPDYSINNRNLTMYNDSYSIVREGIISKSLYLSGVDSYGIIEDFILDSELLSLSFWANISNTQSSSEVFILDFTTVKISFFIATNTLRIALNDGITYLNFDTIITDYVGIDSLFSISIDNRDTFTMNLYINGISINTFNISTILSIAGASFLYIGSKEDISSYYKGIIDEIRIYKLFISREAFEYLYTDRIGNNTSGLDNEIFCEPISDGELIERSNLYFINTLVKANHVKNQRVLRSIDTSITDYTGTLTTPLPIKRNTFEISYNSIDGNYKVVDDGGGNLSSDTLSFGSFSGTINYSTGEYFLQFYKDYNIVSVTPVGDNVSSITFTLSDVPARKLSVNIRFTIAGITYNIVDNGAGGFTSSGLLGSSIDYNTGTIFLNFVGTAFNIIVTKYTYIYIRTPSLNSIATTNYKIDGIVPLTEVGIKNNNGDLVTYATFPKVEMLTNDHISTCFYIYKS